MKSEIIRQRFLDFFKQKGHRIVPSAPVVVKDDPTLLFINAGMNPFKDYFLGMKSAEHPKVADTQKCLRVSGKHNDLEEVGVDHYHHTLFEMLGNWSFGDYFKEEAIAWAWALLTDVYGLDKDRLYITIFEGDKEDNLELDKEAETYWKKWVAPERILPFDKKDNFWEMGDVGPCGPCSEIHIDLRSDEERAKVPGHTLVNQDHEQVIEVWNLVFIEFQRKEDGSLSELPQKHIDTGMGLERLVRVIQGKDSNYDTDLFTPLIDTISELSKQPYKKESKTGVAFRVIADHIRAVAFAIADGQLPSNTGAGYVIRRILRRAVRYGYSYLHFNEPFFHALVPVLAKQFSDVFPELLEQSEFVTQVIQKEEESFFRTLETGIKRLNEEIEQLDKGEALSGKTAFELYDTYGFPTDLTRLIAAEKGVDIREADIEKARQEQQERSRQAGLKSAGDWHILLEDDVQEFVGYDMLEADVRITRYRKVKEKKKTRYHLVFTITPFYAESGGQIGDTGQIASAQETIRILDTKKENDLTIHITDTLPEHIKLPFKAQVDGKRRAAIMRNHSATHLLHHALRKHLGGHVEQRGSLVHPDYLRFDFSHFEKVNDEALEAIEREVNESILAGIGLEENRGIPIEKAKEMGAMALFGEKYGDLVRVIQFGDSVELCGGTHVENTGKIGLFTIAQETAVAAGIRRIEAYTGTGFLKHYHNLQEEVEEAKTIMKGQGSLPASVGKLVEERNALQKELERLKQAQEAQVKDQLVQHMEELNGLKVVIKAIDNMDAAGLKNLCFQLKQQYDTDLFVMLGSQKDGKAFLTTLCSDNVVDRGLHLGQSIRNWAKAIRGGGGGQPFFATAGGGHPEGIEEALQQARETIEALD